MNTMKKEKNNLQEDVESTDFGKEEQVVHREATQDEQP
jgi:hypothetical protein